MATVVLPNVQEHGFSVKEIVPAASSSMIRVLSHVLGTTIQSVGQMVSNLMIFTYFTIEFLEFIFQYVLKIHILSFVQVRHMPTLVQPDAKEEWSMSVLEFVPAPTTITTTTTTTTITTRFTLFRTTNTRFITYWATRNCVALSQKWYRNCNICDLLILQAIRNI